MTGPIITDEVQIDPEFNVRVTVRCEGADPKDTEFAKALADRAMMIVERFQTRVEVSCSRCQRRHQRLHEPANVLEGAREVYESG